MRKIKSNKYSPRVNNTFRRSQRVKKTDVMKFNVGPRNSCVIKDDPLRFLVLLQSALQVGRFR